MSVFPVFSSPFNDLDDADFNLAIYEMQNCNEPPKSEQTQTL